MILILKVQAFIIGRLVIEDNLSAKPERIINDNKKVAVISAAIKKHRESK